MSIEKRPMVAIGQNRLFHPVFCGKLVVVAAAYVVTAILGLQYATIHESVTPIWPPAGIAIAAFLLLGNRAWPSVFIGAFLVTLWTDLSVPAAGAIAVGNTLEGIAGAVLMRRFVDSKVYFGSTREVLYFIVIAVLASTIAATGGAVTLATLGQTSWDDFAHIWAAWWLGDATGIIVVVPFLMAWFGREKSSMKIASFEGVMVLFVALVLAQSIFGGGFGGFNLNYPVAFAPFALLVWASLRLGHRGATTVTILISVVATVGTAKGLGPFVRDVSEESFFILQAFMATCTFTSLALAASETQRKEAEHALQETQDNLEHLVGERTAELQLSEQRMRNFSEVVSDWFWETDENHKFTFISENTITKAGLDLSTVHGQTRWDVAGAQTTDEKWRVHQSDLDAHKPFRNFRYELLLSNGKRVWVGVSGNPVFGSNGEFVGYRGTGTDITEFVKFEERSQQQLKMEALGTLAGGIAHDFNNTLVPIIGLTELTIDELPEQSIARSNLKSVLKAAAHARSLVSQILAFSRQENNELYRLNLTEELHDIMVLISSFVPATIKITKEIHAVGFVEADSTQIHQVVMNLVTNAVHAMDGNGELSIRLELTEVDETLASRHPELDQGRYALITIADNGHGMSEEELDRIFDPFYTTKSVGEGTGLGLSVVHGIISNHKGSVVASSSLGKGTVFKIYLPLATNDISP